jgi:hypothetical protein
MQEQGHTALCERACGNALKSESRIIAASEGEVSREAILVGFGCGFAGVRNGTGTKTALCDGWGE